MIIALPIVIASINAQMELKWTLIPGTFLWLIGFYWQTKGDAELMRFKKNPENKGKIIEIGLWAKSRHPNYFGEITLWAGLTLIALPVLSGWQLVTLISPIFVYVLLTRVSGIPMLENRGMKKWGSDPEYVNYVENTPSLILKKPQR